MVEFLRRGDIINPHYPKEGWGEEVTNEPGEDGVIETIVVRIDPVTRYLGAAATIEGV